MLIRDAPNAHAEFRRPAEVSCADRRISQPSGGRPSAESRTECAPRSARSAAGPGAQQQECRRLASRPGTRTERGTVRNLPPGSDRGPSGAAPVDGHGSSAVSGSAASSLRAAGGTWRASRLDEVSHRWVGHASGASRTRVAACGVCGSRQRTRQPVWLGCGPTGPVPATCYTLVTSTRGLVCTVCEPPSPTATDRIPSPATARPLAASRASSPSPTRTPWFPARRDGWWPLGTPATLETSTEVVVVAAAPRRSSGTSSATLCAIEPECLPSA